MKRFILSALTALSLMAPAHAGGSINVEITPTNAEEEMAMRMGLAFYQLAVNDDASALINQIGNMNGAGIAQNGSGNLGIIDQKGNGHYATLEQNGNNNAYGIFQFGNGANAAVAQNGNGKTGILLQFGLD